MFSKLATTLKAIGWLLKGLWYALVITTPVLGFWLASSLAAYLNGPVWVAWVAGVLAFPTLPLLWELIGHWRYQKKVERRRADGDEVRGRILTLSDRIVLRTLVINLVFLGVLAGLFPQAGFMALSTRGDWMLEERQQPWAEQTRAALFATAGGLEWLYNSTRDNPYEKWKEDEDDEPVPTPVGGELERADKSATDDGSGDDSSSTGDDKATEEEETANSQPDEQPDPTPSRGGGPPSWPMPAKLHPAVATMPASAETSPEAVAKYIAARESDPYLRVKALYDYVTDRIRYDAPALAAGEYPPQDPETVFEARKAVCAGYAKLLDKMAETIGVNVVYVTGVSRDRNGDVGGNGHAWNAVEIDQKWYLIDATWGAGFVEGDKFTKRYNTEYLFTPPKVLGLDHFPDDEKWQLRDEPLTRGAFMRQPMLRAGFFERGLKLIDPRRSQITVDGPASLTVERPAGQYLLARLDATGGGKSKRCRVQGRKRVDVRCDIDRAGTYEVRLFANDSRQGQYDFVGKIGVNAR